MHTELYWLHWTLLLTLAMWVPYVLNSITRVGLFETMGYDQNVGEMSPWAQRAKKAHYNMVENLVIFAPSVLIYHTLPHNPGGIKAACMAFFFARLVHYLVYIFRVPVLRTLSFFVGVVAQLVIIWKICDLLT